MCGVWCWVEGIVEMRDEVVVAVVVVVGMSGRD